MGHGPRCAACHTAGQQRVHECAAGFSAQAIWSACCAAEAWTTGRETAGRVIIPFICCQERGRSPVRAFACSTSRWDLRIAPCIDTSSKALRARHMKRHRGQCFSKIPQKFDLAPGAGRFDVQSLLLFLFKAWSTCHLTNTTASTNSRRHSGMVVYTANHCTGLGAGVHYAQPAPMRCHSNPLLTCLPCV